MGLHDAIPKPYYNLTIAFVALMVNGVQRLIPQCS